MNITELRKAKGLSQIKLATMVGVSLTSIRLYEAGATKPNDQNEAKLKEVLEAK